MTPGIGVIRGVPNHRKLEEQIERQMGCMTGFIQLFDRHQILTGKRFYSTKRLPSSLAAGSTSPSEESEFSTISMFKEAPEFPFSPSPDVSPDNHLPKNFSGRYTLPLPVFEVKDDGLKASWKPPEAPRLSLDSLANVDAKGKLYTREIQASPVDLTESLSETSEGRENQKQQRRSPNVVARLMGLEELPIEETPRRPELRRSTSESRVTRDPSQFNFQNAFTIPSEEGFGHQKQDYHAMRSEAPRHTPGLFQRKSFDAQEFFPEPKRVGSLYGEIEKRLRMRGIEEPARDLETLKQILEALQLKGLLHSKQPEHQDSASLNDFHDHRPRSSAAVQAPIVVMKPIPKPPPRLIGSEPRTLASRSMTLRHVPEHIPPARIQLDRLEIDRHFRSAGRQNPRSPEPSLESRNPRPKRRRPLKDEGQRAPLPQRRIPAAHSPKSGRKRLGSGQAGPPKNRRSTAHIPPKVYSTVEDETSTSVSDTSIPSQFEFESARSEDYRSGRRLLERCDKLLHSIAAITSSAEQVIPTERQHSPVSVLDSSFLSDASSTSSSLPTRAIGFNDQSTDWNEDHRKRQPTTTASTDDPAGLHEEETTLDHHHHQHEDYAFVLDVLRETDLHGSGDEAFASIENRHHVASSSALRRRLIFDTVTELVNRRRHFSPWDNFSGAVAASNATSLTREVWEELCQIQERVPARDVMEATCSLIKKDMAAGSDRRQGWGVSGTEMSEAVLHIERQVFKDLVADTIRELAGLAGAGRRSRRKLVF